MTDAQKRAIRILIQRDEEGQPCDDWAIAGALYPELMKSPSRRGAAVTHMVLLMDRLMQYKYVGQFFTSNGTRCWLATLEGRQAAEEGA